MGVTALSAENALPTRESMTFAQTSGTGAINPGDWLMYSGQFVLAGNQGLASTAYFKSSGAGVALDSNPRLTQAGRSVQNSALLYTPESLLWVSAGFSGQPSLGLGAYPITSGSGVAGTTGLTGVGATWQTAVVLFGSALSGTANAQQRAVATVLGSRNFSNAGTGEMLIRLATLNPAVRG